MGNLLSCLIGDDGPDAGHEDEYDAFQRRVMESSGQATPSRRSPIPSLVDEAGSEERVERRGSIFPPSPSAVYRSSVIPPYPNSESPSAGSGSSSRRGTRTGIVSEAPKKPSLTTAAKEVRILLLGSGESGKSTIIKQMKIIHQNGYSREEMKAFRPSIYRNLAMGLDQVLAAAEQLGLDAVLETSKEQISLVRRTTIDYELATSLPTEYVDAVNFIWLEGGIKSIYDQLAHASYVFDSAA